MQLVVGTESCPGADPGAESPARVTTSTLTRGPLPLSRTKEAPWGDSPCCECSQPHVGPPVSCMLVCSLSTLQASGQADDPLAPSHLEFKFEAEDFAFRSTALGPQAGLGGALRQEAWCALALA